MSARRGRARPGRYRSPYVHGYRSLSSGPILAALAAIVGIPVLIVGALTVTHLRSPDSTDDPARPAATVAVESTVAPPPMVPARSTTAAPPRTCYPFQESC